MKISKFQLSIKQSFYSIINLKRSFSSNSTFHEIVNKNKQESKKLILIENVTNSSTKNSPFLLTKSCLSEKLKVEIGEFWAWKYRRRNFLLIQLNKFSDVEKVQSSCGYNLHALPLRTRMMETSFVVPSSESSSDTSSVFYFEYATNVRKPTIYSELKQKYTSEQLITYLTETNSLSNLDIWLRYFLITQLEEILCQSIFADFKIYPFGSSLAGLGDSTSDLDLVLLNSHLHKTRDINFSMSELKSERDQNQQSLSLIADIVRNFLPNFSKVTRILRARVPIVKISFDLAPIDIDVSIELSETSQHGLIMANYLHYCVSCHPSIKQFLIFLKYWCKQHGVVKNIAGNWFSNFQILSLAIYFLQTQELIKPIRDLDLKNEKKQSSKQSSEESLSDIKILRLIYSFFEFLISFDFASQAISIQNGKSFSKPDFSPLYIENPIETDLNICKNVSGVEFKKLLLHAYNSLDAMHCNNFHLADLLDPEYFKALEKQNQSIN